MTCIYGMRYSVCDELLFLSLRQSRLALALLRNLYKYTSTNICLLCYYYCYHQYDFFSMNISSECEWLLRFYSTKYLSLPSASLLDAAVVSTAAWTSAIYLVCIVVELLDSSDDKYYVNWLDKYVYATELKRHMPDRIEIEMMPAYLSLHWLIFFSLPVLLNIYILNQNKNL